MRGNESSGELFFRVAVFGGTAEGRICVERLAAEGVAVRAFVATAYGEEMIEPIPGTSVRTGRLDWSEMADIFKSERFDAVVDATHPYAVSATENLVRAARDANVFYLRVARGAGDAVDREGVTEVDSAEEAAALLNQMKGNVLLTTGSQQLEAFTRVEDWRNRLFARVLPGAEAARRCEELGFHSRNLIGMHGPFTREINEAMIKMLDIGVVVTKDSGSAGGFPEKLSAARERGAKLIVIRKPAESGTPPGVSVEDALEMLKNHLNRREPKAENVAGRGKRPVPAEKKRYPRFPVFFALSGKEVLIVGGGEVAARRARALLDFGALVTVTAPKIAQKIRDILDRVVWNPEPYSGIRGEYALVIAATDDRNVNRQVGEDAKKKRIPVSVADSREESTFWFPAIARGGGVVCGIVSEEGNHAAVKKAAEQIRKKLKTLESEKERKSNE